METPLHQSATTLKPDSGSFLNVLLFYNVVADRLMSQAQNTDSKMNMKVGFIAGPLHLGCISLTYLCSIPWQLSIHTLCIC